MDLECYCADKIDGRNKLLCSLNESMNAKIIPRPTGIRKNFYRVQEALIGQHSAFFYLSVVDNRPEFD